MSNLGLERFLAARGLTLHRTQVGDRYVVEHMRADGFNVGGEQSGHIILSDYATTGDGLMAALQVLAVLVEAAGRRARPAALFKPLPQLLQERPLRRRLAAAEAAGRGGDRRGGGAARAGRARADPRSRAPSRWSG